MSLPGGDLISRGLGATDLELGIINPPVYRIFIRDRNLQIVDELDEWTTCHLVSRFNATGSFVLEISRESLSAQLLVKGGGIVVKRDDGPSNDLVTVFSGRIEGEYTRSAATLRVAGPDDNVYLEAPARPTPSQAAAPYPNDYDVFTGTASTVMRRLVDVNIGPSAPEARRVDGLTLAVDPLLGIAPITSRARLNRIVDYLAAMAATPEAGGLGFRVQQSDTVAGTLEFVIYQPRDQSADAVFSIEQGTIQDFEDTWQAPGGNYFIVAGEGLGENRTIIEGADAASIDDVGREIAVFVDARDTPDAELPQKLSETLAGAVASRKISVVPFDVPSLQHGADWDLGDLVTFVVRDPVTTGSDTYVDLIREIDYDLTLDQGAKLVPMIGQAGASNDGQTAQHITSVEGRLSNIERNWNIPDDSIIRQMLTDILKPPIGKLEWLAGSTVPPGYLLADGSAVSRSVFSLLFGAIGTTWGVGDGSTTFNLPNAVNRFPIGAGGGFTLGMVGGSFTSSLAHDHTGAPHTHPQTHAHGVGSIAIAHDHGPGTLAIAHDHGPGTLAIAHDHPGGAHTHPGSHSHGAGTIAIAHVHSGAPHTHPGSHSHGDVHNHLTDIDHNHPSFSSGDESSQATLNDGTLIGTHVVANSGHHHAVDVPALGSMPTASGGPSPTSTDPDSNVFAASFSGNSGSVSSPSSSGSTDPDSNVFAATYTGTTGAAQNITKTGMTGAAQDISASGKTDVAADISASGTTGDDSTASAATFTGHTGSALSATTSILPPYIVLTPVIYAAA